MQTRLPLAQFPAAGAFLQAYADPTQWTNGPLAGWFHYNPHDPDCFAQRLAELDAEVPDRQQRAGEIAAQLERWGAGPAALAAAQSVAQPNTYMVLSGQQTGLLGGPLYTPLKALASIRLARQLKAQFPDRNFVPVFWLASADSDYDEVRKTHILNRAGEVVELALPPSAPEAENLLVGSRDIGTDLPAVLDQLAEHLPGGEYREAVLAAVSADYRDANLVDGFARWMCRLFAGTELVVVDFRALPSALRGVAPLIHAELEQAAQSEAALLERNAQILAAGFALQVEHLAGDTNLFLVRDGRRFKISHDASGLYLRQNGERLDLAQLLVLAESAPASFGPGVLLQPLFQGSLLPTAAFLGGGAELAYRAQSAVLFERHSRRMAPAFLRASATLLPEKSAQTLTEQGWELADLYAPAQEVIKRAVALDKPEELTDALQHYLDTLHSADARLKDLAVNLDPTLEETFDTLRGNLIRHVEKLDKKITGSLKQRSETRIRRVTTVQNQVYPRGHVQERALNLLSFLPRYGFGLLDMLLERLDVPSWEHQVVVL
jgi:bacillithiol synthase